MLRLCGTTAVDVSSYLSGRKESFYTRLGEIVLGSLAGNEPKSWEWKSCANSQKPQLLEQNVMLFFSRITKEEMRKGQRCHLGRMLASSTDLCVTGEVGSLCLTEVFL